MTSKIKVDNINKVSDDSNIINKCGTTITLGASGDTIALASGASQTGFGRTGTVDWQTSSIKTSTFTAVNGQGFFANTAGGAFDMNLPAGSAGAIVSVQDYNNTFDSNALTVKPNGTEKINGGTAGGSVQLGTEGEGITLVYIDATVGWRSIQDNVFADQGSTSLLASGGTITTDGDFKVHTFTGPGTFCVSQVSGTAADNVISYLVVGGGGGGGYTPGSWGGGGGGAGGFREFRGTNSGCYAVSPLNGSTPITVTVQGYPIVVGGGGTAGASGSGPSGPTSCGSYGCGGQGVSSVFSTVTSAGGGFGGGGQPGAPNPSYRNNPGGPGGSGGGAASGYFGGPCGPSPVPGGTGNTPPVSPPQGQNGGAASSHVPAGGYRRASGGGGGAGAAGTSTPGGGAGAGGAGVATSVTGSPVTRAGGGGGGGAPPCAPSGAAGGSGGGGAGGMNTTTAVAGTANTGGGGGGGGTASSPPYAPVQNGATGGSGVIIIRYKFQ